MLKVLRTPLLIAAVGALPFVASSVIAQQAEAPAATREAPQTQPAQQPQAAPQQQPVSEKKIDNFVSAYSAVHEINQEYSEKLQGVTDAEKATELQQEAQGKMQEAVQDTGLSIEEYQEIASQAAQDDALRERIQSSIN